MKKCKILMPSGGLGGGIEADAFANGMHMNPDVIAIDAGSTDSGPAYLANAMCKTSRNVLKADLEIAVRGSREGNIPLFIGSCGTCGSDNGVNEIADIVEEILKANKWTAKIAKVYSEQNKDILKQKFKEGKIHPLEGAPEITEQTFDECEHIVALMGAEPFIKAYQEGADIVLCGRTTDTAIIAALPIMMGCNEAAAWHGAKTVECGSQCCDIEEGMGVFLEVDEEGFYVRPLNPKAHCTPYTISAHLLYENVDPFCLVEPSG
ncbi:MAG: acyclic terpene utilization AtuA family protein, partial [Sphaerochaetaceae bacterium]